MSFQDVDKSIWYKAKTLGHEIKVIMTNIYF